MEVASLSRARHGRGNMRPLRQEPPSADLCVSVHTFARPLSVRRRPVCLSAGAAGSTRRLGCADTHARARTQARTHKRLLPPRSHSLCPKEAPNTVRRCGLFKVWPGPGGDSESGIRDRDPRLLPNPPQEIVEAHPCPLPPPPGETGARASEQVRGGGAASRLFRHFSRACLFDLGPRTLQEADEHRFCRGRRRCAGGAARRW